ncbi:unnamed protein product [Mycena citricolor]|uniref:Uncharacterized protein n=1 Tax=Mycena citricolor TaxID=2018698 RepID=A0AAD2H472_9AGAR|nr:unnamed protein product [Mycena citricolor]CAK5269404.1 unnamed protein product [Mycena citricolor]CAK5269934.1 unnamed protein product [Mycena citricolor]
MQPLFSRARRCTHSILIGTTRRDECWTSIGYEECSHVRRANGHHARDRARCRQSTQRPGLRHDRDVHRLQTESLFDEIGDGRGSQFEGNTVCTYTRHEKYIHPKQFRLHTRKARSPYDDPCPIECRLCPRISHDSPIIVQLVLHDKHRARGPICST